MTAHTCTIPGQPIGKGRPRVVRTAGGVRGVTPPKTRHWTAYAVDLLALHLPRLEGPVRVTVDAVGKRPKRLLRKKDPSGLLWRCTKPDSDNVAKAVLDAMTKAGVIRDDVQVVELYVRSLYAERDGAPRVEVTMAPVTWGP